MNNRSYLLLDGAMGTMLQAAGLPAGSLPEVWNITQPDKVTDIQRQYVQAGSGVIYANTFGANRLKTAGCGYTVAELVKAGVAAAKKAAEGTSTRVALDIGPLGKLMAPLGTLSFEEAYDVFREMLVAGEEAGADLVIFETMSDLLEVKAGVLAAKENTSLPVWTTMTLEKSGRTFVGVSVPAMALTLSSLGVEAIGFNCSLGPAQLLPMVRELSGWTDAALILKPNAGLPDTGTGTYTITPADFVAQLRDAAGMGVGIFGGCCGTGPAYIAALHEAFADQETCAKAACIHTGVCSSSCAVEMDEIESYGMTISPENPEVEEALQEADFDTLGDLAMEDLDEDCEVIQVFLPEAYEALLPKAVQAIQSVVNRPLMLRAHSAQALEAALRVYNGRPVVAVSTPEQEDVCRRYGAQAARVDGEQVELI